MFLLSSLEPTGPGFVVRSLADEMIKHHSVTVSYLFDTDGEKLAFSDDVKVLPIHARAGKTSSQQRQALTQFIEDERVDVIFSHTLKADLLNTRLKPKRQVFKLSTSHNNPFEDYLSGYGKLKGTILALLQMWAFRHLDFVVTLNPALEKLHRKFVGKKKVATILNGVEPIQTTDIEPENLFGVVATFNHRKHQVAIAKAQHQVEGAPIVFWGDGPDRKQVEQQAEGLTATFPGFTTDKSRIFSSFKMLISASESEGMPLSVLEAISAGKPLILSDIPAHRFIGEFLPQGAVQFFETEAGLADSMRYWQQHPEAITQLKPKIEASFDQYFTAEKMSDSYLKLIENHL
ncbi:glycosyltransferase family 4 protein [Weissella uvarum]|nr:glycosyltransferase family 4 protein [Weissella uvarum]MCM0596183.1 glycosyltransferase family 4 protein [Weissella uvarum]